MEKRNPCDSCRLRKCGDCVLDGHDGECFNEKCFINFEDTHTCLLGLYGDCGAWERGY